MHCHRPLLFAMTGALGVALASQAEASGSPDIANALPAILGHHAVDVTTVIAISTITVQGGTVTIGGGTTTVTAGATGPVASPPPSPLTDLTTGTDATVPSTSSTEDSVTTITVPPSTSSTASDSIFTGPSLASASSEILPTVLTENTPTIVASGGFSTRFLGPPTSNGTLNVSMTPTPAPTSVSDGDSDDGSGKSESTGAKGSSSSAKNAASLETSSPLHRRAAILAAAILVPAMAF
ncbi:hypothetical protein GQ53DRAFT_837316 [Thozetella sp. PMI_491]|nr:hypothetical protein GQ53DRAFT_837316 [Thozetella sp. PMI_491]